MCTTSPRATQEISAFRADEFHVSVLTISSSRHWLSPITILHAHAAPVSYTHLLFDELGIEPEIYHLNEAHGLAAAFHVPVSYTHLDVYKRQDHQRSLHRPENSGVSTELRD